MSTAATKLWISEEEYLRLEAPEGVRYEYYRGELYSLFGGTIQHSRLNVNTQCVLGNTLRDTRFLVFGCDLRIKVGATGLYTYPDLSVCCGRPDLQGDSTLLNPILLVEILSPSTEAYDRGMKSVYYRQIPSLQHYLLIAQDRMQVEHYARTDADEWSLKCFSQDNQEVLLPSLGIQLPLNKISRNIEWESAAKLRESTPLDYPPESA